jgi:tetratricopeptide (TPR) repeat protein
MKALAMILLTFWSAVGFGQTPDVVQEFKQLYDDNKYDALIAYQPKKRKDLPARAIYYIAMAHYMKSEDDNTLKYLNMAIDKGPADQDMYFFKGMTLFYKGKYKEALPCYDKAIAMSPNEPIFYSGKSEVFYITDQVDSALHHLEKAMQFPDCKARAFLMAGELYQKKNDIPKALVAYEAALTKVDKTTKEYRSLLFNLGLMNQLSGNPARAKELFEESIAAFPDDYHCMAKLIQSCYALGQIDQAKPHKEKLYEAFRANKLPLNMKEMFCFDQFEWNGRKIMAFELYDETNEVIFVKHRFYVMDEKGEIDYKVQSESSVGVRMVNEKAKYVLCLAKDGGRFTYWHYVFNDDYDYNELKREVINILDGKVKPGSSTVPSNR